YEEGVLSARAGVHFVSTTMSGYTDYSPKADGPDTELIARLSRSLDIPVIGEGKIHSPEDAASVLKSGAFAAVVGGAITRPLEIARRFMMAVENRR
ncbi:MAG: N-acetylmannosamine-6-phosphate 2-epimerase, partial [Lacrimispora sp.]